MATAYGINIIVFEKGGKLYGNTINFESEPFLIPDDTLFVYYSNDRYKPYHPIDFYKTLKQRLQSHQVDGVIIVGETTDEIDQSEIHSAIICLDIHDKIERKTE